MNDASTQLIHAYLDGEITSSQKCELSDWLQLDRANVDHFVAECRLHSELCDKLCDDGRAEQDKIQGTGFGDLLTDDFIGTGIETPFPSLSTIHYPLSTNFVGGPVFSYMVATLVLCMMLLGAWAYKITRDAPIATNDPVPSLIEKDASQFVARITGMKDCQWPADAIMPMVGSYVPLGRKYSLDAGLLQITYESGARVILEGPCIYTVDSKAGGRLQLGKLVARVEQRGERREERGERSGGLAASATSAKPQAANPQPPAPLFAVRTPTAVVTDLGTEFGVEVDENGDTTSYVFQGTVKVETMNGTDSASVTPVKLNTGESIRVTKNAADNVRFTHPTTPPKFVRRIYEPPKMLDLLDIIAGGDGTGRRRECGIDPATGMEAPIYLCEAHTDKHHPYRLVNWHQIIDGVFIPDGRDGAVRLDSAGHRFDGFPPTSGNSFGPIWSRAKMISNANKKYDKDSRYWIYAIGQGDQYMPKKQGLLGMCGNVGITVDLEAIRKQMDVVPVCFNATAGIADASFRNPPPDNMADIWIFVDGRVEYKRMKIRPADGVFDINVKLTPNDRFFSLVTTDGGNGSTGDWVVFGDPILLLNADDNGGSHNTPKR